MGNDIKTREKSFSIMRILKGIVGLIIPYSFFQKKPSYEDKVAVAYYRVYLAQTVSKLIAGGSYNPKENNGITLEGRNVANAMIRSDKYLSSAIPAVIHIAKHVGHTAVTLGGTSAIGVVGVAYNANKVVSSPMKYIEELGSGTLTDHVSNAQTLVKEYEDNIQKMAMNRAIPTKLIQDYVANLELSDRNMKESFEKAGFSVTDDDKKLVIKVGDKQYGIIHDNDAPSNTSTADLNPYKPSPKPFENFTKGEKVSSTEFKSVNVVPAFGVVGKYENSLKQDQRNNGPEQENTSSTPRHGPGGP